MMQYIVHVVAGLEWFLLLAGGKTQSPEFNLPIRSLNRQFCRIAQTINKCLRIRASFNSKCIFNHTTKEGLTQKTPHVLCFQISVLVNAGKLFTYRYGNVDSSVTLKSDAVA